jgi:hypothetical protein
LARALPETTPARVRWSTLVYVEKVRSQFLSLRQQVIDIIETIVDRAISDIWPSRRSLQVFIDFPDRCTGKHIFGYFLRPEQFFYTSLARHAREHGAHEIDLRLPWHFP